MGLPGAPARCPRCGRGGEEATSFKAAMRAKRHCIRMLVRTPVLRARVRIRGRSCVLTPANPIPPERAPASRRRQPGAERPPGAPRRRGPPPSLWTALLSPPS
eukprot:8695677-Alexandrium_andersonii.AAC.1